MGTFFLRLIPRPYQRIPPPTPYETLSFLTPNPHCFFHLTLQRIPLGPPISLQLAFRFPFFHLRISFAPPAFHTSFLSQSLGIFWISLWLSSGFLQAQTGHDKVVFQFIHEGSRDFASKRGILSRVKGLGARKAQGSPPRDPNISI